MAHKEVTPDELAKKLFTLTLVGVVAYAAAVIIFVFA